MKWRKIRTRMVIYPDDALKQYKDLGYPLFGQTLSAFFVMPFFITSPSILIHFGNYFLPLRPFLPPQFLIFLTLPSTVKVSFLLRIL